MKNISGPPIRKILAGVDGSEPSLVAAQLAINIAEKYGSELVALYVISPEIRYGYIENNITPGFSGPMKEIMNIAMGRGQECLDTVKAKVSGKDIRIQTEIIVAVSSVVKEIVEYAEKKDIDLVVIGTRGLSGIKKMLLGSTASGVVTYSHCPVLVVK